MVRVAPFLTHGVDMALRLCLAGEPRPSLYGVDVVVKAAAAAAATDR